LGQCRRQAALPIAAVMPMVAAAVDDGVSGEEPAKLGSRHQLCGGPWVATLPAPSP